MGIITVETFVAAPIERVWETWTNPEHITKWCHASDDWHAPEATNDLHEGGTFTTVMAARDGSSAFDFSGTYTQVREHELIAYTMADGRTVRIFFEEQGDGVKVTELFEPEKENPIEMQRSGWQAILNNFKAHAEHY